LDISIIIPVWNEADKIENDIRAASTFLTKNKLKGEILIVDDGSEDDTAIVAKNSIFSSQSKINIIRCENHRGKGYAVQKGIGLSKGEYVMFADSGHCVPYDFALAGLNLIKNDDYDIAHGSRKLSQSKIIVPQTVQRQISAKLFRWMITLWLKIPNTLTDTQCGFKIYKGDIARNLYSQCQSDGFMFDIEIILQALQIGYRIREFPIEWTADRDSRLSVKKNLFHVFLELKKIKRKFKNSWK
jgi:dolichyl-phosphate beta-glucosyltransferase